MNELSPHKATPTFIYIIDDVLSSNICEATRSYIDIVCTEDEKESNPDTNVSCKASLILPTRDYELYDIVGTAISEKIVNKFRDFKMSDMSIFSLRKIKGHTRRHIDSPQSRPNSAKIDGDLDEELRVLSVIIALNDDYDDGEFIFPHQDIRVKLKKGQAIAFPPYWTHPHLVTAPTNGTFRYTINTWILGK